ncbi:cytochrome P450 71B11-like [Brassica napus]|uniref:cytochrome P450 71B11-like n=1 Tax=Brassica napus TaxID=3708 RepID=UPI0020785CD5|nr:cytochrome P450 71B11-like [Brassica napus]
MDVWYIILAIVFFASILVAKNTRKTKKNLPPGPPRLLIIGNLHQLGSKPHRSMFKLSEKYGALMSLKLGNVSTVVASTPETVKDVLKTFDVDCCSRPYLTYAARLSYNRNDLSFSPYSKYWREMRKLTVIELYTAKRVKSFGHIREEEVASFVDFIKQSASVEKQVNFNLKFMKLSASVICRLGFGMSLEGSKLEITYDEVIQGIMEVLGSFAAADFFPIVGKLIDRLTGLHGKCEKVFQAMDTFFDEAIKCHLDDESIKDDIIALLLKMERGEIGLGEFQLSRNHTKGILLVSTGKTCNIQTLSSNFFVLLLQDILVAGIDTSAQTATWVMTHLITNPRVMNKVQTEVREVVKNKDNITEDDIEQLKYLKMVIKETLRINPLVPLLIPREASKDIKIRGYDIPKNTWIYVNVWAIHSNPNIWKDPGAFIPERFVDNEIDYKGLNFELLAFGSGRRMCPGMGVGMALVHLILVNLLYRFDWKLPEGMETRDVDLEESYGLVCPKKIPLELIPVITKWS